jgi:hypothetical protein
LKVDAANQVIPYLSLNSVHPRVHNSPPLDPVLSQMNPMYIITSYFFKIRFNIIRKIPSGFGSGPIYFRFFLLQFRLRFSSLSCMLHASLISHSEAVVPRVASSILFFALQVFNYMHKIKDKWTYRRRWKW